MPKKFPTEQEKNLNASTLFTLFIASQILSRPKVISALTVFLVLDAIWAIYEWAKWFRVRDMHATTRVVSLADILHVECANVSNSYIILGIAILIPCFVILGVLTAQFHGAIMGLGLSVVYVICMIIMRRYPID